MGKINELLIEATEDRMSEMLCEWDEAWDWALEQSIEGLLNYVEEKRKESKIDIDDVINYYQHKQLDEYEDTALHLLIDYKDVLHLREE